jgi:hypothetical protein
MASRQDEIWNRACLERGGPTPSEGDSALASLLLVHGLVMNGGVLHALESLAQEDVARAIGGYRYFGLSEAAEVLAQVYDDTQETEEASNSAYWRAIPGDETIQRAFRLKLLACPDAFTDA